MKYLRLPSQQLQKRIITFFIILALLTTMFGYLPGHTQAVGQLSSANVSLSDSRPNQTGASNVYTVNFKWAQTFTVKCVVVKFTTTAQGSTEPGGMVTTSAAKGTVSGTGLTNANWSMYNTNDGSPQFENSTGDAITTANAAVFPINTITSPNSQATFYAQITAYDTLATHTCSQTTKSDTITVAFATTNGIAASVTVDPSLTFTVAAVANSQTVNGDTTSVTSTATTIPFGTVNGNTTGIAAQDLTVATNGAGGWTAYAKYTAALTDGASHTIADATGSNSSPATFTNSTTTSAFGYTTASSTLSGTAGRFSGTKYAAFTTTNAEIAGNASAPGPDSGGSATRVGYKVAVSNTQAPGTYTTTVVLTATPTY